MLGEVFDQGFVLGQPLVRAVEFDAALLVFAVGDQLARLGQQRGNQVLLQVVEVLDRRAVLFEKLVFAFGNRAGDDERRTRVVDQHGVYFVDDGEMMLALHEVFGRRSHVVAQVVEAVFVVRAERDVGHVGRTAGVGVGLRVVDAGHRQPVELVHRPHPFAVSLGQVVVDRYQVHAFFCQCVEEHGERRHQGFALARGHLGDFALVEHHAAEELHVVVDHVPLHVVAAGQPVGGIEGLVALDAHEVLGRSQLAVEIVGCYLDGLVLRETARRVFHDGERLGQDFVQLLLDALVYAFGQVVDLLGNLFFLFKRRFRLFELRAQLRDAGLVCGDVVGDAAFQFFAAGAQTVVRERLDFRVYGLDFLEIRFDFLAILVGFRAEDHFDQTGNYIHR